MPRAILATWTAAFLLVAVHARPWTRTLRADEDAGPAIRASIEADWIERDRAFEASGEVAGSFSLLHSRRVLERAVALANRLRPDAPATRLFRLLGRIEELSSRIQSLEAQSTTPVEVRRALYLECRWAARAVAFTNPLLSFDKLLFIKRHAAGGVFHMCDQYYGCNAQPGGGLFVLLEPFGQSPRLVNILERSKVENGRLRGDALSSGAFLSPDLSYDGRTILFAYSEARAKKTYQWAPEYSYHIFRVEADGTGLRQLTDGSWDDFDPCFLPNGRIAFLSERRGGYLRCGRHCPVYTLHSMAPDGTDIVRLSHHETHEWHPSVAADGRIVYTRWDYVDRDTNIAHHVWLTQPDGRNPRSFHGNYPKRRESRPWMEMSLRAVPGSHKFVGTAGAHHGHAFGSLFLIDQWIEDDGAMSQLERLTPEVPFPEAEGGKGNIKQGMVYGTPWPLSEDDYLCAYDLAAKNHGIYWIDRHGNRELIYRDPSIASVSPIPLRPRSRPPVLAEHCGKIERLSPDTTVEGSATVAVLNVYDGDFAWPPGTRISQLRIVQLLPKTTPPPNEPRIGVAEQTNARAILGTVPVEPDGSIHFEAPAGKALYFQALDEDGYAVQSMRSVTYLHPGETLVCQGCHERKHGTPPLRGAVPLALRRPPSRIRPGPDGSNPFSFVRLVQPVLDRHCVGCHTEGGSLDLRGVVEGPHGWTRSYQNLAGKHGFYFHVTNGAINRGVHGGSRTAPGQFGALAASLDKYLDEGHYGVSLPAEDRRRVTLWLDANSEFYGAYEDTSAQALGKVVHPSLE